MLEYIFFHNDSLNLFVQLLEQKNVPYKQSIDSLGKIVSIPENLDDETADTVDEYYEELLASSEDLLTDDELEPEEKCAASVTISLPDGKVAYAGIPPELLNRILTVVTPQELGQFIDLIVNSVLSPDHRPFCSR